MRYMTYLQMYPRQDVGIRVAIEMSENNTQE